MSGLRERAEAVLSPTDEPMRMDAYYYGFDETGVAIIDRILSAVAIAGKGHHHTDGWTDEETAKYYDDGLTHEQRIQKAADDAASTLRDALTADEPTALAGYMVAPDAYDELAIWRGTPDDLYPVAAITQHELRHDPALWDVLVAAVERGQA